jgi:raffinose/stachyose/melibiose transport system permease protein
MFFQLTRRFLLLLASLAIIVPSAIVIMGSFKTDGEVFDKPFALPQSWALTNYRRLFNETEVLAAFRNSVVVTLSSVVLTLILASLASYAIARMVNITGTILFALFGLGLAIPAQVNIVPIYVLFDKAGLVNTLHGLILINVVTTLPISVFILTSFFRQLPKELYEVASIDGASHLRVLLSIALPLARPAIGATSIFLFVINWNDLLYPLLLITRSDLKTLPLAMFAFRGEYFTSFSMIFTGVMVASIPMVLMYLFMQKSFIAGLTSGAVKG